MKAKIIVGPGGSGKTHMMEQLAKEYPKGTVVRLNDGDVVNKYSFHKCDKNTQLICVDEVAGRQSLSKYVDAIVSGLEVHRKYRHPIRIYPKFVFAIQENVAGIEFKHPALINRLEVIVLPKREVAS